MCSDTLSNKGNKEDGGKGEEVLTGLVRRLDLKNEGNKTNKKGKGGVGHRGDFSSCWGLVSDMFQTCQP